ncbi:MAG TPA: hypothetical protein VEG32_07145 [Clostridia bacterium]|nr:hypothetical protein [Clostridia bacterium]
MQAALANAPGKGWFSKVFAAVARVVLLTLVAAGLGMAAGLLFGIVYLLISAAANNTHADLTRAYRQFGFNTAVAFGALGFVAIMVHTIVTAFRTRQNSPQRHRGTEKA